MTRAVHGLRAGDTVGLRGPYGNHFPLEDWRGRDLLVIGGGIGLAPLRPLLNYVLANRKDYGRLQIVYGAVAPGELLYRDDREAWRQAPATEVIETVDAPAAGWGGRTGLIPAVLKEVAPKTAGKIAATCGPPIMIRFTLAALQELGFPDEAVFTTLEMKMQCGLGKCGRCNIGGKYVCRDGPVFSAAELGGLAKGVLVLPGIQKPGDRIARADPTRQFAKSVIFRDYERTRRGRLHKGHLSTMGWNNPLFQGVGVSVPM